MASSATEPTVEPQDAELSATETGSNKAGVSAEKNQVTEGLATILIPATDAQVFYNPIQQFNRDLSVMAIRAWSELFLKEVKIKNKKRKQPGSDEQTEEDVTFKPKINIIEALSATGLRAIRYAKEIPQIGTVIANDLLPTAMEDIKRNVEFNKVEKIVTPNQGDANRLMYSVMGKHFQVVDLDPYGTAAPFIDAAIQAVEKDGLLLVTCTDLSVLAGSGYPEKCFALYGGTNVKSIATHESALRLVISSIASSAAKYRKCVEPLLSLSIDFYVRIFIRVLQSPINVKDLASTTMVNYLCSGCNSLETQLLGRKTMHENNRNAKYSWAKGPPVGPICEFCGAVYHVCGPMWAGPLHNKEFCEKILSINERVSTDVYKTTERIKGMVTVAKNELDAPFYFSPSKISSIMKIQCPPLVKIAAALGNCGYDASLTHAQHGAIKTDAPWSVIWSIFVKYIEANDIKTKVNENTYGYKIQSKSDRWKDVEVSFEENEVSKRIDKLRKVNIVRYQQNPTKNWGPKARP